MLKVGFGVSSFFLLFKVAHPRSLYIDCILKLIKGFHDFADDAFTIDDKALEVNEEILDLTEGGNSGSPDNQTAIDEVPENAKIENDMGFQTMSADDNVEVNECSDDFAALDINDGAVTEEGEFLHAHVLRSWMLFIHNHLFCTLNSSFVDNVYLFFFFFFSTVDEITVAEESAVILPKPEEECVDNNMMKETTAQELNASADLVPELTASDDDEIAKICDDVGSLEEDEYIDNNLVEETETIEMELNACADAAPKLTYEAAVDSEKSPIKQLGIQEEAFAYVPFFPADDHNVVPTCLTPLSKKSASKTTTTPLKKSASKKTPGTTKKLSHLFDDKENIDNSGSKLILLTKEKKKNKDFGLPTSTQYIDVSLRKLKKELKEKLETGKNLKKDEQVSSRPVLQAVSENIVVEKNSNNPQDI